MKSKYKFKEKVYVDGFYKGEGTILEVFEIRKFFFFKRVCYGILIDMDEEAAVIATVEEKDIKPLHEAPVRKLESVTNKGK